MRVALACHNFPPEFWGGTERVVLALALCAVALLGAAIPALTSLALRRVRRR